MAGWDHPFDIDARDDSLLRDCLKIWRRTCARHRIEFHYYRDSYSSLNGGRIRYWLAYDLNSADAPLAVAEFIIEMRAVSTIQQGRRKKYLPLRLLRDIAWFCTPDSVGDQLDPDRVPQTIRDSVEQVLLRYQTAYSAYQRNEMEAADFLESQHSLVINLALLLGEHTSKSESFPQLIEKLVSDPKIVNKLSQLGQLRNKVKHRGQTDIPSPVVDEFTQVIWSLVHNLTGAYVDPVSVAIRQINTSPATAFRLPLMYFRNRLPRVPKH